MIQRLLVGLAMTGPLTAIPVDTPPPFEKESDHPLMGDWTGRWLGVKIGRESARPELAAQLLPTGGGTYKVLILPELYKRAQPYAELQGQLVGSELLVNQDGWKITFRQGEPARGVAPLHGGAHQFELSRKAWTTPTLGMKPPKDAVVLFDGSSLDAWQHHDGSPCSWRIVDGSIETVSRFWKENQASAVKMGDIRTRESFGSFTFHMEFRYPVEEEARGQSRGNSGLFLQPIGELQILNSYTTPGWWNEAGALYESLPAKVNAAGPPLVWQTYDVSVSIQPDGKALLSARLNGHAIHHLEERPCPSTEVTVMLQDHINRMQFRNIWLVEE